MFLIHEGFLRSAAAFAAKEAVAYGQDRRTYAELADEALRFARALQDAGLRRGDRVALHLENTVAAPAAIFGVLLGGGVLTVVSPQTKTDKLAFILNNAEASFLVTEPHRAAIAAAAARRAPSVKRVYVAGDGDPAAGLEGLRSAIAAATPTPEAVPTIALDLAALVYTSGTTGNPKGVMMSHGALAFAADSIAAYLRLDSSDRILSFLPLAFTYGLSQLLLATRLGATLLLERSFAFPAKTLERAARVGATVIPAVPTAFATIIGLELDAPLESVRRLTNAAAGLPPALHAGLRRVFPNAELYRMYGQTECIRGCYLEPELIDAKPTSVGGPIPGTETMVLGPDGAPVPPGEVGVLHIRGPHLMMGYWREPELTERALVPGPFPGERMLCTRDHFTVDADGHLYFVDRSDDIIKSRGEKVSSVEVENAIYDIPGVRSAAVIGVPDELLGQTIRAYVVLQEGATLTPQQIIRECRARLENYMVPGEVRLVDELPHTDSGKVRKASLRVVAA
jgi:acyl-CoA synthetase (AMP-forming)/AMP-acid ligase II